MAGHSKFKNIQYRKGAQDARRARDFARLSREISVAVKEGGGSDPGSNARLRGALSAARSKNMPRENMERAMKRGGESGGADYESVRYEGFGSGGAAMMVEALTDNRNRAASAIRAIFVRNGGVLGETGSATHMFEREGEVRYEAGACGEEEAFEAASKCGAKDCRSDEEGHVITCEAGRLYETVRALEGLMGEASGAGLVWRAIVKADLSGEDGEKTMRLLEDLEENDDVQAVYTNYDLSGEGGEGG